MNKTWSRNVLNQQVYRSCGPRTLDKEDEYGASALARKGDGALAKEGGVTWTKKAASLDSPSQAGSSSLALVGLASGEEYFTREGKTTGTRKASSEASSDSETEAWSSSDGERTKIEVDSRSSWYETFWLGYFRSYLGRDSLVEAAMAELFPLFGKDSHREEAGWVKSHLSCWYRGSPFFSIEIVQTNSPLFLTKPNRGKVLASLSYSLDRRNDIRKKIFRLIKKAKERRLRSCRS